MVNLADAISRDPRHKYCPLKANSFLHMKLEFSLRGEPTQDEQNFRASKTFRKDGDIEEETPVPITDRDAEGAVIGNEKEQRR